MAELASVTDASDVPQAVLGSVGLRESRLVPDGVSAIVKVKGPAGQGPVLSWRLWGDQFGDAFLPWGHLELER